MYYATIKKGSKRIGIATWDNGESDRDTCLAHAQAVFLAHGIGACNADYDFNIGVHFEGVTKQKNWGGMAPDAQAFTDRNADVKRISEIGYARTSKLCGKDWAYFVSMFAPEVITESDWAAICV